jgi:hypothetical protein
MLSKEEINLRFNEGPLHTAEGIEIIRSYVYLRKGREIVVIPPRNPREAMLYQTFLQVIRNWSA